MLNPALLRQWADAEFVDDLSEGNAASWLRRIALRRGVTDAERSLIPWLAAIADEPGEGDMAYWLRKIAETDGIEGDSERGVNAWLAALQDVDQLRRLFRDGGKGALLSSAAPSANWQTDAGDTLAGFGDPVGLALDTKNGVPAVRRNLLRYSEQFDNAAWTKHSSAAVTANQAVAPDGTMTADLINLSADADARVLQRILAVGIPTSTAAVGSIWLRSVSGSGTYPMSRINGNHIAAQNVALTEEWQRFEFAFTTPSSYSGTAGAGLYAGNRRDAPSAPDLLQAYAWGAQLELGSTATAYQRVDATWADTIPGAHFSTSVTANRLTRGREPMGGVRNLLDYSEQFDNAAWGKVSATVSANATTAPYGEATADKFIPNTAVAAHQAFVAGWPASGSATISVFAKPSGYSFLVLRIVPLSKNVWFDVQNGVVGVTDPDLTASISDAGNGWYRCSVSASSTGAGNISIEAAPSDGVRIFAGNDADGLFIWGAQLELGSVATAYQTRTTINDVTEAGVPDVPFYRFDGVSDRLEGNATARDILKATPGAEAHAAIRWDGGAGWVFFHSRNGGTDPRFALRISPHGQLQARVRRVDADDTTTLDSPSGVLVAGVKAVVGLSVNYLVGGAVAITIWVNGVAVAQGGLSGTGNTSNTTADAVVFGADAAGTQFYKGLIYREHPTLARVMTDAERSAATARMVALAGVPATVPPVGYFPVDSANLTINNMRVTGVGSVDVLYTGANGVTHTDTLADNVSKSGIDLDAAGLTAPIKITWPSSVNSASLTRLYCHTNALTGSIPDLSANTAMTHFWCNTNALTGSIPDLSANTALTNLICSLNALTGSIPSLSANTALMNFSCHTNALTGPIPDLSANTDLVDFRCSINALTGSIPSLTANTALQIFRCNTNALTGVAAGFAVAPSLGDFRADNNSLTQAAVDAILAAFVAAGRDSGERILNLAGNAVPSAGGLTDRDTLVTRGWTVTVAT